MRAGGFRPGWECRSRARRGSRRWSGGCGWVSFWVSTSISFLTSRLCCSSSRRLRSAACSGVSSVVPSPSASLLLFCCFSSSRAFLTSSSEGYGAASNSCLPREHHWLASAYSTLKVSMMKFTSRLPCLQCAFCLLRRWAMMPPKDAWRWNSSMICWASDTSMVSMSA